MWQTFGPDVLVAVIGALLTALLTVLIAFATFLLRLRLEELRAVQSLVSELHRRRALTPGPEVVIPGAAERKSLAEANASVLSIRDEVRRTRDRVRQVDSRQVPLSRMTAACNRYLEISSAAPDSYAILLGELSRELDVGVRELVSARSGTRYLQPGAGAFQGDRRL